MKFVSVQALLQEYLSRPGSKEQGGGDQLLDYSNSHGLKSPICNPSSQHPFPVPGYVLSNEGVQPVHSVQPPEPGTTVLVPLHGLLPHVVMSLYGDAELLVNGMFGVPQWVSSCAEFKMGPLQDYYLPALVRSSQLLRCPCCDTRQPACHCLQSV